jgi:hypothetical protein
MDKILTSLRTLLIDHLAATESLSADMSLGDTLATVPNTSRFREGDEIYIISETVGFGEVTSIRQIIDDKTILLQSPTVRGWKVSENSYIQKAINHQIIKRIHIGDIHQNPSFPVITIEPQQESNEWMTLRGTSHEYRVAIRAYVLADNFEQSNIFLPKLTQQIREVLIDHIRPIIDGESHPLTADFNAGGTVVTIADTSAFASDLATSQTAIGYLRDAAPRPSQQESYVKTVLSSTQLELYSPANFDYLMSRQAEFIRVRRMLYDTRPESIDYGYVPGENGTFLKASQITWFGKELICREGPFIT